MTGQKKYSCQGCDRTDLSLTANGKVRSHAADGKRVSPTNPACGRGSDYPRESTEFHTHTFQYGDDGNGHSGSVCTCGMDEDDAPALPEPATSPAPPNPFRSPLPGGVWDQLPHDRQDVAKVAATPPVRPGPTSADDFLDGSDDDLEDAEDHGPSYWEARYDGECVTCFAAFSEGDMIRRVDDGYEARDCCGFGAVPKPETPKSVARTLPVVRGRYVLPDPETGRPIKASRASKFAEGIADSYALDQWRHRMILVGVVQDPEILDKVASGIRDHEPIKAVKARREFLNDRAEEAMSAAGGDIRSGAGTTLHKYTEEVDAGTRDLADVPKDFRPDATAYRLALAECGFRPVKGLIERSVFSREMQICGTFDRVLECVRTTDVLDLDGRQVTIHEGEYVIGDVKSGDNIEHPWLEILIQEALYAHAINENGVAVADPGDITLSTGFRWAGLHEFGIREVREDVGIVMHVPYGSGECHFYAADLVTGWRGAEICKANRDFWKIKLPKVPIATYAVTDVEPGEPVVDESDDYTAEPITPVDHPQDVEDRRDARLHHEGVTEQELRRDLGFEDHYTCHCGEQWSNVETANAYDHDTDSCGPDPDLPAPMPDRGFTVPTAATVTMPPARCAHVAFIGDPETHLPVCGQCGEVTTWETLFTSVRDRDEAVRLWSEAKSAGVPSMDLHILGSLVQLDRKPSAAVSEPVAAPVTELVAETGGSRPPAAQPQDGPSLTERAHAVTTKEEASAVFKEARAKIDTMPEDKKPAAREYLTKLTGIMKERLAGKTSG